MADNDFSQFWFSSLDSNEFDIKYEETKKMDTTKQEILDLVLKVSIEKNLFSLRKPLLQLGAVQYIDDYQYASKEGFCSELQNAFDTTESRQLFLDMALGMAVEKEIPSLIKDFIQLGGNPNCIYPDDSTPLLLCAANKNLNCFEELIKNEAKIEKILLYVVIESAQNLPMIGRLMKLKPDMFNVLDIRSKTNPLLVALLYNKPKVLDYLFTQIDPSLIYEMVEHCLPLHRAVLSGRYECVEALLQHTDYIKVNQRSLRGVQRLNGDTPLLCLARRENNNHQHFAAIGELLISQGADVYADRKEEGKNALVLASNSRQKILANKIAEKMGLFPKKETSLIQFNISYKPLYATQNNAAIPIVQASKPKMTSS